MPQLGGRDRSLAGHGRDGGRRSFRAGARPGGEPAGRQQEPGTVRWGDPPQEGGGSASASGTTGSGAHSIVAIRSGRSRWRWRAVRRTLASKWLGYRDSRRRNGVALTVAELTHFRGMVHRIAALLMLRTALDDAYEKAGGEAWLIDELGGKASAR